MKITRLPISFVTLLVCGLALPFQIIDNSNMRGASGFVLVIYVLMLFLLLAIGILSALTSVMFKKKLDFWPADVFASLCLVAIFLVFIGKFLILPSGSFQSPFDSVVWRSEKSMDFDEKMMFPRQKMLGDVVRKVLPGKSRQEIEALLGKPDGERFARLGDMVYVMGPQRDSFFGIDYEWLVINLENDKFKNFSVFTD